MSILEDSARPVRRARRMRFRSAPLEHGSDDYSTIDRGLEPDHLARKIARVVNQLPESFFSSLWSLYAGFGSPAYPPQRLLAAVLFEIQRGHHSPAQWYQHAKESDPLRWLLFGFTPSRACWYQFRDRLGPGMLTLVEETVKQAIAEGFTPAQRAAVDGTLVAANASRHRLLNETTLAQRCHTLQQAIAADPPPEQPLVQPPTEIDPPSAQPTSLASVPTAPPDEQTPARSGADDAQPSEPLAALPGWLAPTPRGRREQKERYDRARQEMQRRQNRNRQKRPCKQTAAERIVISVSDPEAAVGRDKEKVFRPLYNVQLLDDLDSPLILSYQVVAQPNDAGLLGGLLRQARDGLGRKIEVALTDSGYTGGADLAEAYDLGATVYGPWQANDYSVKKEEKYYPKERFCWLPQEQVYECPQGKKLTYQGSSRQKRSGTEKVELQLYRGDEQVCAACSARGNCTGGKGARTISRGEHEEHIEALRERMKDRDAKTLYKQRKQTVELANADMKQHRSLRKLSGRGKTRAATQVGLVVLAHDLVTLDGLRRKREREEAAAATPSPDAS
jgi:transposase